MFNYLQAHLWHLIRQEKPNKKLNTKSLPFFFQ